MFNDYQFTIAIETISQVFVAAIFIAAVLFHVAVWWSVPQYVGMDDRGEEAEDRKR